MLNSAAPLPTVDICGLLHPTKDYISFPNSHGPFIKTDNVLGHKNTLTSLKRIETTQHLLLDHMELQYEPKPEKWKPPNTWRLSNTLLNNPWVPAYGRKEERPNINNLIFHFRKLQKGKGKGNPK
jgi:hypothetical protein